MVVSKKQRRDLSPEQVEALCWLGRELAWEGVLDRLRHDAGVEPLRAVTAAGAGGVARVRSEPAGVCPAA